jgi:starvation-inducible DNA-binding protein
MKNQTLLPPNGKSETSRTAAPVSAPIQNSVEPPNRNQPVKVGNGPAAAPKMYETENDISQKRRVELNALMNQRLADAVDLQMQMKQAHWNVKGPSFIGLHELFDKVDEAIESYVDMIAERIVQLGGIAEGTVRVAAARTRLPEYPLDIADGMAHVEAVARALSTFGQEVRSTINQADDLDDADTGDLFTEVSRGIDKWLWFVEAHSQAAK